MCIPILKLIDTSKERLLVFPLFCCPSLFPPRLYISQLNGVGIIKLCSRKAWQFNLAINLLGCSQPSCLLPSALTFQVSVVCHVSPQVSLSGRGRRLALPVPSLRPPPSGSQHSPLFLPFLLQVGLVLSRFLIKLLAVLICP